MLRFVCLAAVVLALLAPAFTSAGVSREGRTFYVSPSGSDRSSGTDPRHAWRSVSRVNSASLRPGDRVLFRGDGVFNDSTLTPPSSGTSAAPIVFGSFGRGRAIIVNERGAVWFTGKHYLVFDRLQFTTHHADAVIFAGSSQPSTDITVRRCAFFASNYAAINQPSSGDARWTIADSTIEHIGDSGLILQGHNDVIEGNVIADVGWNQALDYGKHGIYVKAPNVDILRNRITDFWYGSGVTLRDRNARLIGNQIGRGGTAISFYREGSTVGTSLIKRNRTFGITRAAFYYDVGGGEGFVVTGNTFAMTGGTVLDLAGQPAHRLVVTGNRVSGSFEWAISARYSGNVGFSEFRNAFTGAPMFAWGGHALTYPQYRAQSGQGAGDTVGLK
jgi:hypothetical protein